jgi:signal transduction histidine kinase
MLVALVLFVVTLWRYPEAELVLFHLVWIALAIVAMRASSERFHVWILVCFVAGLAIAVEIDDLRTRFEVFDTLVELSLDLPGFVALVVLGHRQRRLLITERAAAAADQRRHERQRAFFANAAHALRTPITIARGHTELAMRAISDPVVRADLAVALDELDRLTRAAERNIKLSIVGDLDRDQMRVVDTAELVRTTVERWRPTADRSWSAEARGSSTEVVADPEQLTEALDALIENAVLATTGGDSITVRSEGTADTVVLSVIDTGCGVEDIDPEFLFEPFEQGPNRPGTARGGTGLGLAVVRAVAIAHGGTASMESAAGEGATVRITLPARARSRRAPQAEPNSNLTAS